MTWLVRVRARAYRGSKATVKVAVPGVFEQLSFAGRFRST